MQFEAIEKELLKKTPSELWHLAHPEQLSPVYYRTPTVDIDGRTAYIFDWKNTLEEHDVGLIKETRYTNIPPHVNRDMELDYIYSGTCSFDVQNELVVLNQGDTIIFDTDVVRSSPSVKGDNDIVISLVFRKTFFDSVFLSRLPGGGMLTSLVFDYISRKRKHDRYLVVPNAFSGNMDTLINLILSEYLNRDSYSDELIKSHLQSVFVELTRGLMHQSETSGNLKIHDQKLVAVLEYIERNYKTCTLASLAETFGYNRNYLSNLLKSATGRTFSQIKAGQQMSEAAYLLANTDRPIAEIASKVGITNMNYFYRKFYDTYAMKPTKYRSVSKPSL